MPTPTPDELWSYARAYARANHDDPEVRQCARRFKTRQGVIIELAEAHETDNPKHKLDLIVGARCGGGVYRYDSPGSYRVEAYVDHEA